MNNKPIDVGRIFAVFEDVDEWEEAPAGMVENAIQNDAYSTLMCRIQEGLKSFISSEEGINQVIIVRVIPVVGSRLEDRIEIDRIDAKVFEVIQLFVNPIRSPLCNRDSGGAVPFFEKLGLSTLRTQRTGRED